MKHLSESSLNQKIFLIHGKNWEFKVINIIIIRNTSMDIYVQIVEAGQFEFKFTCRRKYCFQFGFQFVLFN